MHQIQGRPALREGKLELKKMNAGSQQQEAKERRLNGDPAKYNTRADWRRISWENDLYERQSI